MGKKTTNLATKEPAGALATADAVNEMFGGGLPQIPLNAPLPQALIMRESQQFEMPDGAYVKELVGHILFYHNANQFYAETFGEGESLAPTCASSNGITPDGGTEPLAGPCSGCPNNEFGSGVDKDGNARKGKACNNTIRLYVLLDGNVLPTIIKAPPSSIGSKDSLIKWLTNAANVANANGCGAAYQPIKVNFSLVKKEFKSGMSASCLVLETVKVLSSGDQAEMAEITELAAMTKSIKEHYITARVVQDVGSEKPTPDDDTPF
jgi:hypothetical protein